MSPVKIALVAILLVAFACGHVHPDPTNQEIDTKVPELAEQHTSDDETAQAKPDSDDEMAQALESDDEMAQQSSDDGMAQLPPRGVTKDQFVQAMANQKARGWWRRRHCRRHYTDTRRRRRRSAYVRRRRRHVW